MKILTLQLRINLR